MITSGAPDNYGHSHLRAFKQPHLQNPLCPFRLHVNTSRHTVGQALYPGSCRTQMVCPLLAQGWKMLSDRVHRLDMSRWALGSVLSSGRTGSLWVWRLKDTIHHEDPERQSGWKDYVKAGRPGSSGIQRPRISGNLTETLPLFFLCVSCGRADIQGKYPSSALSMPPPFQAEVMPSTPCWNVLTRRRVTVTRYKALAGISFLQHWRVALLSDCLQGLVPPTCRPLRALWDLTSACLPCAGQEPGCCAGWTF